MDLKSQEWNNSYKNKDNFVFYPHEDVIRFISKYIKKQIGLNSFKRHYSVNYVPKVLDFGCGIGRHIKLLDEFKLDAYGFDLSKEAIDTAKRNFISLKLEPLSNKVIVSSITNLPYQDSYFDFMLSHGVLDSMPLKIASAGLKELWRCLKPNGFVYFDLIAKEDSSFKGTFEKTVTDNHEKGTIQTYFNLDDIKKMIQEYFQIEEIYLISKKDLFSNYQHSRYHIIVKKI